MRGRGRAGVWQGRTAQNSGRIFALDGAWGAKVGLDPPKTDAIFIPGKKTQTTSRTVVGLPVVYGGPPKKRPTYLPGHLC